MELIKRVLNHFGVDGEIVIGGGHEVSPDFVLYDIWVDNEHYALCRADYIYNDDEVANTVKQTLDVTQVIILEPVDSKIVDEEAGDMSFVKIDTGDVMNTFALAVIK